MKNTLIVILMLFSYETTACSCGIAPVEEYLSQCDHLFIAPVKKLHVKQKDGVKIITGDFGRALESFKGSPGKVAQLEAYHSGNACDIHPEVGVKYLVCGRDDERAASYSHCSFTIALPAQGLPEDLGKLRLLPRDKNQTVWH